MLLAVSKYLEDVQESQSAYPPRVIESGRLMIDRQLARRIVESQAARGSPHDGHLAVSDASIDRCQLESVKSYIIMPRYGCTLESYLHRADFNLPKASVYNIGVQLIENLRVIHSAGYVYNDLKLDNVMMDFGASDRSALGPESLDYIRLTLIDFGFATPYLDRAHNDEHIGKCELDLFQGNLMFGSAYQLGFTATSRRDDLISVIYLLIFIMNKGQLLDLSPQDLGNQSESMMVLRKKKKEHTLAELCSGRSSDLGEFIREVFSYRFQDRPNYEKLSNMLQELVRKEKEAEQCAQGDRIRGS